MCDFFIGNYDFQQSKGGLMFSEKYYYFIYVLSGMYTMTICDKGGIKAVYNYVTGTSTPSGHLTS